MTHWIVSAKQQPGEAGSALASRSKWEALHEVGVFHRVDESLTLASEKTREWLDKIGREGWELVSVTWGASNVHTYYFKRSLSIQE